MLNKLKKSLVNLLRVFSKAKYVFLALLISFLFYTINFFISAFGNISSFYKEIGFSGIIPFTFNLFVGFKETILFSSFISFIVLSLMTGILFSLILYKAQLRKEVSPNNGFLAGVGMFLGIFAPGCAACGLGLAAFFGLAASFASLPLKGLEISILAGMILVIATLRFSYTLFDDNCPVNLNNKVKGGKIR